MSAPLLQHEADLLRTMAKRLTKSAMAEFSMPGVKDGRTYELESVDGRTSFLIDANRQGKFKLTKCTYQERYRSIDILARLDIDGPPHTNPLTQPPPLPILAPYNGVTIPCPHFHFYVEGYDVKWAVPAGDFGFNNTADLVATLREFMTHCGVEKIPHIQYPTL